MKIFLTCIFLFITTSLWSDQIFLKNKKVITGKILSIDANNISYYTSKNKTSTMKNISITEVEKIIYDDGITVLMKEPVKKSEELPLEDKKPRTIKDIEGSEPYEPSYFSLIWKDLSTFPMQFSLIRKQGNTDVKVYDKDDKSVADGSGEFNQYMAYVSYEPLATNFYITPELGYFYRTVTVKDYSYSVDQANAYSDNFIPGVVTDPITLEEIDKDLISSLRYKATFHSFFLDIKAGAHLVFIDRKKTRFIFNPYASASLVELRETIFEFTLMNQTQRYKRPYKFAYLSSYGYGCEFGIYVPWAHAGVKIGYDKRYLAKFELPEEVRFKEVYYDESTGYMRTRENKAKYTEIEAKLMTIAIFFSI